MNEEETEECPVCDWYIDDEISYWKLEPVGQWRECDSCDYCNE